MHKQLNRPDRIYLRIGGGHKPFLLTYLLTYLLSLNDRQTQVQVVLRMSPVACKVV